MKNMKNNLIAKAKKTLSLSFLIVGIFFAIGQNTMASTPCSADEIAEIRGNTLLGIPPWYKYLPTEKVRTIVPDGNGGTQTVEACQPTIKRINDEKTIPRNNILLVVAAILEILVRVAGLAAFIYLIYGGFMYLTSGGNSENVKKAGSTLLNAAIGLAIAISATTFINFFAGRLAAP
jgi:hypothetical protein